MDRISLLSNSLDAYRGRTDMMVRNMTQADVDGEVAHSAELVSHGATGVSLGEERVNFDWVAEKARNKAGEASWYHQKINDALTSFVKQFGTKDEKGTIAHNLNGFAEYFAKLTNSTNPDDAYIAVKDFESYLDSFSKLQKSITDQRKTIVGNEEALIERANEIIKDIAKVNFPNRTPEQETALCRNINALSQIMDIDIQFKNDATHTGVAKIFLAGQSNAKVIDGTNIMGALQYTPVTAAGPGQSLGPINFVSGTTTLNLRNFLSGGMLGGFTATDNKLIDINSALDYMAKQFMDTINAAHNEGTSGQFAPSTLTGEIGFLGTEGTPLTNATVISGQGTWRIAMHDANGRIVDYKDIALTPNMTVGGLITSINAGGGYVLNNGATFTASLTADGRFQIASGSLANKISLGSVGNVKAQLCAGNIFSSAAATNASAFFHLNDLISRQSIVPGNLINGLFSNLKIRDDIVTTPRRLSGSVLSSQATMAANDFAVSPNGTNAFDLLFKSLTQSTVNFNAVGDFSATNTNILDYATNITSHYIQEKLRSDANAKTAHNQYEQAKLDAGNKSGKTTAEDQLKLMSELERRIRAIEACLQKSLRMEADTQRMLLEDVR